MNNLDIICSYDMNKLFFLMFIIFILDAQSKKIMVMIQKIMITENKKNKNEYKLK